ncbi:MAG TPA: AsmA-like C-terminal region-containing protein [Luteolibacter sp.]|nr:AsmA-like C-terminal region-containing protein [Luteolibacter sp.]
MHRKLNLILLLRSTGFVLFMLAIVGGIGALLWLNQTGMPESWRKTVERGMAARGLHVRIGALSIDPFRGILAREVRVYSDAERTKAISRLEGVILDLDKTRLARGEFLLSKVILRNALLELPLDPEDADSEILTITDLNGTFVPPGNRRLEIRNARGMISGVAITLNARIQEKSTAGAGKAGPPTDRKNQRQLLSGLIKELRMWNFDPNQPPQLDIRYEEDRNLAESAHAAIILRATGIEKNHHSIDQLEVHSELAGGILTVGSIKAVSGNRHLTGRLDYDTSRQRGRFDLQSTLDIPGLMRSWVGVMPLQDVLIAGTQELHAAGSFRMGQDRMPELEMTGRAMFRSAMWHGVTIDSVSTAFAWSGKDLYLKNLVVECPEGKASGKVLMQGDSVRLALTSNLPPPIYRALFIGKPLERIINDFQTTPETRFELSVEGGYTRGQPDSWAYIGRASGSALSFRGVAIKEGGCDFAVSHEQELFSKARIHFDYRAYSLSKRFSGTESGLATVERVLYRREDGKVRIEGLQGSIWPAPLVRMFAPKVADHLESYQFHTPPALIASGSIATRSTDTTEIDVVFKSSSKAEYVLFDAPLTLERPSARVLINGNTVKIEDLAFQVFSGPVKGRMEFLPEEQMRIDLDWSQVEVEQISSAYKLNMKCGGLTSGDIDFRMRRGDLATMQGSGNFALEKTELFSVPIFGPLSHLMSALLRDKTGFERANSATCTYQIKDGVLITRDFNTSTSSLVFVGDGAIDLKQRTMDMTMRIKARGMLVLLRPFSGMLQYRGTGPLNATEWRRVMFADPGAESGRNPQETPGEGQKPPKTGP